jgi:hypothetical protein
MEKLPARTGWLWVKEGFALFRQQPAEISALFLAYMLLMIAVGVIPLIGQLLPLVLVPVFAMAFMEACADIEQGKKVYPNLLLTGFRSPAFRRLLTLGVLYLVAAVIAVGASVLVDGGVFWKIMSGAQNLDEETIRQANLSTAMMLSALVYLPFAMAFWYAAPLIAWQDMAVSKAVFYSFFAVRRSAGAFIVYGLAWIGLGVLLPAVASSIVALLFGRAFAVTVVVLTLSLVLTVIMYCSFYPTYTHVFGRPRPPRLQSPD